MLLSAKAISDSVGSRTLKRLVVGINYGMKRLCQMWDAGSLREPARNCGAQHR